MMAASLATHACDVHGVHVVVYTRRHNILLRNGIVFCSGTKLVPGAEQEENGHQTTSMMTTAQTDRAER